MDGADELFEQNFYVFSSIFRELAFIAYSIRREIAENQDNREYNPQRTPDQIKLENIILECSSHMLSRCCYCGIGYTLSDCRKPHLLLQSGGRWRPDSYINTGGTLMAYCGRFFNSIQIRLLLKFINTARASLEGTHLGRPSALDSDCNVCIYCVERFLLHDKGYTLMHHHENRNVPSSDASFKDWMCGETDDDILFDINIS